MTSPQPPSRTLTAAQSVIIERFSSFLDAERARAADIEALRNIVAMGLRHFVHPDNSAIAFELMALAAEAVGEELTPAGIWESGARGELWLHHAVAFRAALANPDAPEPTNPRRAGHLGFTAYNDEPGPHGPWKTFNGRAVLGWDDLGEPTRARWVAAGRAERDKALEMAAYRANRALVDAGIKDTDVRALVAGAILSALSSAQDSASASRNG
ncbi:hypothetical protein JRI60_13965 [Archangium violaceum]|uniref:hypothetical protein n=1 Tax=Archangium violaceum TaxID=83451 RepID=UPI001952500C|nr:hypothetical protein [Archangium violaceum]QRO00047.1 hypothetical protein JRI60_13965 [Archangium violaceum]